MRPHIVREHFLFSLLLCIFVKGSISLAPSRLYSLLARFLEVKAESNHPSRDLKFSFLRRLAYIHNGRGVEDIKKIKRGKLEWYFAPSVLLKFLRLLEHAYICAEIET